MIEFLPFPKIARLSRECVITEKIDGTNAQIFIEERADGRPEECLFYKDCLAMYAGSRTRWITPSDDNYGFAKWALENSEELLTLGPGQHFGEWWGQGIQRRYGITEKRFSLFNTSRWSEERPSCCHVVPVLHRGEFDTVMINRLVSYLREQGSIAAPGFMNPEGIVIWHDAAQMYFKKTLDKDEEWKGKAEKREIK